MEPQIRYARTSDGVSIAYYALGSGPPLIATSPHLGMMVSKDWESPPARRIAELSSRVFTYIRYDPHGSGLSDRNNTDLSIESFVRDLEAVADAAAPDTFALFANGGMTAPAIVYAARHPDRLTHLLLWMVFTKGGDHYTAQGEQMVNLALTDWRAATESSVRAADNWEHDDLASQSAAMMREAQTPETFVKFERERLTWDVSEYLPRIATPTLIIHPRNHPYFGPEPAQRAAAAIPGARLTLIDSSTVLFPDARVAVIAGEFLGTAAVRAPGESSRRRTPGTAVILFTDIADSTALTERLGDATFRAASRRIDEDIRAAIRDCGGSAVAGKVLGDGVMGVFTSATQAIQAAQRCAELGGDLGLHIGLHAGDVIREDDNVYGGAVNIASRVCALCAPGEILVSQTVRDLARTSAGVVFEDRGEQTLKGIDDGVRVFAVRGQ